MPWVVFDPVDRDYLCQEQKDRGGELWDPDVRKATRFDTDTQAQAAFDDIDVDDCLPHIHPRFVDLPPPEPPRKRWEEMTFDEKMAQVEEDFTTSIAEKIERRFTQVEPSVIMGQRFKKLLSCGYAVKNQVHDEYLVERSDGKPMTQEDWDEVTKILKPTPIRPVSAPAIQNIRPKGKDYGRF